MVPGGVCGGAGVGARVGGGDPPAGERRARRGPRPRRAQKKGGNTSGFGGQLQPTQRDRAAAGGFAQHRRGGAATQSFFHGPQDVGLAARTNDDHPRGIEAEGGQSRAMEVASAPAPNDDPAFSSQAGEDRGAEARRGGALVGGVHLVQASQAQTAA